MGKVSSVHPAMYPMEDHVEVPNVERSDHSTPKIASRKNGGWVIVYDAAILVHYLPEGWT
jgi:hypothetical protein